MKSKKKPTPEKMQPLSIHRWHPSYIGIVNALLFLLISVLPSLLPRPWWLQGFISGVSMAIGYGLGLLLSSLIRWFVQKEFTVSVKNKAWKSLKIAVVPFIFMIFILGYGWQNDINDLLGLERIGFGKSVYIVIATMVIFWLCILIGRGLRRLTRSINRRFVRRVPARVGMGIALFASFLITYLVVSGLFVRGFYVVADRMFSLRDATAPEGIVQPQSMYRSGSPASLIPWEKVGFQGRGFVGGGPTATAIADFSGQEALEPIRVYAGLASADTAQARADLALAELKRTNAFDREVLVIATATGTGWLDPTVVDALEFIYNGNSAIVSQQYSYLPSWISFLVDQDRAREAGRVLYDTVIEEWATLPEDDRPKLLVYGLSLGSFGGQTAFSGVNDMRRSVDGALFTGTPNDTEVWRRITASRDAGSPEWQPVIDGGRSVRFASTKEDILADQEVWSNDTRILFVQHANDPVVWFSFDLLFNKPDWLSEERGRAVSPATRWFPMITFLHVGLDQAIAASAPLGNGHYYTDTTAYAWAAIASPEGWTVTDSERLQALIDEQNYKTASTSL
jgi:uncharacterized membrane protein